MTLELLVALCAALSLHQLGLGLAGWQRSRRALARARRAVGLKAGQRPPCPSARLPATLGIGLLGLAVLTVTASPLAALASVAVAFGLGSAWRRLRRHRQLERLRAHLPHLFTALGEALGGGASLQEALRQAAGEQPEPLGAALTAAARELALGEEMEAAMRAVRARVPLPELAWLGASFDLHLRTGGNLAELLRDTADLLREQIALAGEERALTAEARLSAVVIGLMPPVVLAAMLAITPSYVEPLLHTQSGRLLLLIGGGLEAMGFVAMRRLTLTWRS